MVGEALRYMIPCHMQCSIGCGGQACKYEDPSHWSEDRQAIRGVYSSWITDNLLAMARPSTEIIEKFDIIEQFLSCGLKTVINLQCPGEHASCGNQLDPESGFTYRPETFMEAGIYFYNFRWNDYGVASLTSILDMVKVMSFAIQEGKIAVHCHAGLGRTGVLLACFLLFTTQMTADQAILLVRGKRPNSIQTRGQLQCVRHFAQFLVPLRNLFASADPEVPAVTLQQFLIRQNHILHGYEARQLRFVPKLVPLICRLLLDIAENRQVIEEDIVEVSEITSVVEKPMNENLNYQFNRELPGNGMTMIRPRLPGLPRSNGDSSQPLYYVRKSLSYSESDLLRLAASLNLSDNPLGVLASIHSSTFGNQMGFSQSHIPPSLSACKDNPIYSSTSNIWELKTLMDQAEGSEHVKSRRQSVLQRSRSVGISDEKNSTSMARMLSFWKKDCKKNSGPNETGNVHEKEHSEVPVIKLQSELSLESRRLLVAQSLAVDLEKDGGKKHIQKVATWQTDLNRQGAWERLCLEKDPFVLSGILWSWLEQLKEPIISAHDLHELHEASQDPTTVLNSLDRASRETVRCILDCFAHLFTVPEEVESAFLERAAKAFTQMKSSDVEKSVWKLVLHDLRSAAMNEFEV
ncbi:protein tyrosine phosphatase domain-containing protein 1 [Pimephales promelas]|uniref:protein tyrosine phosphatase domain-containing protein 1 n=1 Tax=Pimephales promelas TaxID=90988 RepID=UPI001955DCF1|nr:protein tyrosine phosphatase domain-containing protein 1 [Pimephales promelas]KAG1942024.1 protein tyrosine phosphatase domain-containing protein [Pimephales promelas]